MIVGLAWELHKDSSKDPSILAYGARTEKCRALICAPSLLLLPCDILRTASSATYDSMEVPVIHLLIFVVQHLLKTDEACISFLFYFLYESPFSQLYI